MLDFEFGFPTATARRDGTIIGDVLVGRRRAVRGPVGDAARSIRERRRAIPTSASVSGASSGTPAGGEVLDQLVQRLVGVGDAGGGADQPVETELAPRGDLGDPALGVGARSCS